jgi:transaldolase
MAARDVAYVEALALPDTIVTLPEKTLLAFADHGVPRLAEPDAAADEATIAELSGAGEDLETIAAELESAGLRAFRAAYAEIIDRISGYGAAEGRGAAA